jgi:acetoin utilization protein AcuB
MALCVRDYMTKDPLTVESKTTLADAQHLMREKHIRHLPVVDGGKLVGVVSDRDLNFTESMHEVDPATVTVDASMSPEPFTVAPDTSLEKVADTMAKNKYGSVMVLEGDKLVGVFTTVDGMRALADVLRSAGS